MARPRALAASIPGLFSITRILSLRLDKFRVDGDGNIITHQKTAGLKCGIPHESEVFAIDFGYCGGTDTGVAPWIFTGSRWAFHGEPNLKSDAVNRQITDRKYVGARPAPIKNARNRGASTCGRGLCRQGPISRQTARLRYRQIHLTVYANQALLAWFR